MDRNNFIRLAPKGHKKNSANFFRVTANGADQRINQNNLMQRLVLALRPLIPLRQLFSSGAETYYLEFLQGRISPVLIIRVIYTPSLYTSLAAKVNNKLPN